ncbi:MAG: Com family DNA-binding transcriptional regulator [Syntrophomonas sp.]
MKDFRCEKCQKLLGKYRECEVLEIKCPRCGAINTLTQEKPRFGITRTCSVIDKVVN